MNWGKTAHGLVLEEEQASQTELNQERETCES